MAERPHAPSSELLAPGGHVPFFEVTTVDGPRATYRNLWQRKNLLLVVVPAPHGDFRDYVSSLNARMADLSAHETAVVITQDSVDGVPRPGVLIADRWGEIHHVAHVAEAGEMPDPEALIEWLRYVQHQCPECQGETR